MQLGTNGTVDPGDFDRMMTLLSDRKKVVIVNAKVPRPWEQQVNDTLAAGVKKYKNAVLLDWHGYGSQHPEFFYDDGIHLRPEGAAAYAQFVAQRSAAARRAEAGRTARRWERPDPSSAGVAVPSWETLMRTFSPNAHHLPRSRSSSAASRSAPASRR